MKLTSLFLSLSLCAIVMQTNTIPLPPLLPAAVVRSIYENTSYKIATWAAGLALVSSGAICGSTKLDECGYTKLATVLGRAGVALLIPSLATFIPVELYNWSMHREI